MSKLNLAAMSAADLEALLNEARKVQESHKDADKAAYAESIEGFVTQVFANETPQKSEKSDWVGYSVRGINVVVDGHAFTVSVTITDTQAKEARGAERKLEEARALLASVDA